MSLVTMARQTLGARGAAAASVAYVFLHYALLVAYMSKAGEIAGDALGLPLLPSAALFAGCFALLCYGSSQRLLDQLNGALVLLVVACFLVSTSTGRPARCTEPCINPQWPCLCL